MTLSASSLRHRFPVSIISQAVWIYHQFNNSYRDIEEQLAYRGIQISYETIRAWSIKFANHFRDVIKKRERKPKDKWHLDEMNVKINAEMLILDFGRFSYAEKSSFAFLVESQKIHNNVNFYYTKSQDFVRFLAYVRTTHSLNFSQFH